MLIANSTESWIDSSTAPAVFDGSVRTPSQLPQPGDIAQLKIHETDMALGPPSVTIPTSARGEKVVAHHRDHRRQRGYLAKQVVG